MPGIVHAQEVSYLDMPQMDYAKSAGLMSRVATNSTESRSALAGGGIKETLGGADNDCIHRFVGAAVDMTKVGTSGSLRARVRITEAATDNAEFFCGLSDGFQTATTGVLSNTAGAFTSGDHIGFYIAAESLFWRTECVSTSTATAGSGVTTTAVVSATTYILEMDWIVKATGITVRFYIDGVLFDTITDFATTGIGIQFLGWVGKATNTNAEVFEVLEFTAGNKQAQ